MRNCMTYRNLVDCGEIEDVLVVVVQERRLARQNCPLTEVLTFDLHQTANC